MLYNVHDIPIYHPTDVFYNTLSGVTCRRYHMLIALLLFQLRFTVTILTLFGNCLEFSRLTVFQTYVTRLTITPAI